MRPPILGRSNCDDRHQQSCSSSINFSSDRPDFFPRAGSTPVVVSSVGISDVVWFRQILALKIVGFDLTSSCSPDPLSQRIPAFVDRPFGYSSLRFNTFNDLFQASLHHHTSDDHLAKYGVQCFKIENQIQLANVLEKPVKRLDEDLDQIKQPQR